MNDMERDRFLREALKLKNWSYPSRDWQDCHEMEMALPEELRREYIVALLKEKPEGMKSWWYLLTATPRQRAEVMVR